VELIQSLLEKWGDGHWEVDLKKFLSNIIAHEADTPKADIEVVKSMLHREDLMKTLKGPAMFQLLDIILSIEPTQGGIVWHRAEKQALLNHFIVAALEAGDQGVDDLEKHVKISALKNEISNDLYSALVLRASRKNRTPEEIKFDDDHDMFIFIARDKFIEHPKKSGNFRKTLEIENLYKIDRFEAKDHAALNMMKIRAQHQGNGSTVYAVELPKDTMPEKANTKVPDWLVSLIDEHKRRI